MNTEPDPGTFLVGKLILRVNFQSIFLACLKPQNLKLFSIFVLMIDLDLDELENLSHGLIDLNIFAYISKGFNDLVSP